MSDKYCKYEKMQRWVSYNSGVTWSPMNEYQKGELIERDSVDCGWEPTPPTPEVEYRWVDIPLADDFYCSGTTKYYKQKMQQSEDSGSTWTDVVPPQYRMGASAQSESSDCGYASRTTSGSPYCDDGNKVVMIYYQVSDDHGASWTTTSSTENIIEYDVAECGYATRTTSGSTYCSGTTKMITMYHQESRDYGQTWSTIGTSENVVEYDSEDCGYVPPTPTPSYADQYFTIVAREDGELSHYRVNTSTYGNYVGWWSKDGGETWNYFYRSGTGGNLVLTTLNAGERVLIKGKQATSADTTNGLHYCGIFRFSGDFDVEGNVMSLAWKDDFRKESYVYNYAFKDLLYLNPTLINAENLVLPAATLTTQCYEKMFQGCTSLVTAPELPATTLAYACYNEMFNGCTSLTTAPYLPATTLAVYCYQNMFSGCTSLTSVPDLPARTLSRNSYKGMFAYCTSLTTAPVIYGVDYDDTVYSPSHGPCDFMFSRCTSLNYIKCCITQYLSYKSYMSSWVAGVSPTGTFVKASGTSWSIGSSGIPENWIVVESDESPILYRWTDASRACVGYDYHLTQKQQYSLDNGVTWQDVSPLQTKEIIEYCSTDCGYVPTENYLTFRPLNSCEFTASQNGLYYSLDGGTTWSSLPSGSTTPRVHSGDTIMWKSTSYSGGSLFRSSGQYDVCGNVMSLLYGDNFIGQTSLNGKGFGGLFYGRDIINAKNLALPATSLTPSCYDSMFRECGNLVTAPQLLATTLAESCYRQMFQSCSSLTTAPELPATTLAPNCYQNMFTYCSSLTTAPELPATTLANRCYDSMFWYCTNLTSTPVLSAATLVDGCYRYMFDGCGSLSAITCLATDISASDCTTSWVNGVAASGVFTKALLANWPIGTNGIPSGWISQSQPTIVQNYLSFVAREDGTFSNLFRNSNLYYSLDSGATWATLASFSSTTTVHRGEKIMWKGSIQNGGSIFTSTGDFDVEGNAMSLVYGDNFSGQTSLEQSGCLRNLFSGCTTLINASGMTLPATTLAGECYAGMFQGCTNLVTTPQLPATTLEVYCYKSMFNGCTSLTTAPELPATTLATTCYASMFNGCTSLTTAPELPATTLAYVCYAGMFQGCTSLTTAPQLPATTLQGSCYMQMFEGCTSLTTAPQLLATTLELDCYRSMFANCTSLTVAPELQATTLAGECYYEMFNGCTSLNSITCLATNGINSNNSTTNWVNNVASSGTFYKNPNASWPSGSNGIPNNWTVIDAPSRAISGTPYCSGTTKVVDVFDQISINSGTSWITTSSTISVVEYDSADCGYAERWIDIPLTDDYYCSGTTKYYKQKKQQSTDSGSTWSDVVPAEYRMGESAETQSADCGYAERWVDIPLADGYYCSGTTKYYKQKMQQSEDSGSTWSDVVPAQYRMGESAETQSSDCGYAAREISGTPYCSGSRKVVDVYHQESEDSGTTWTTTSITVSVVEYDSTDCGYDPEGDYLTFKVWVGGSFKFSNAISYSLDGGVTWNQLPANTSTPQLQMGDIIKWKGNLTPSQGSGIGTFSTFASFNVYGNIMSLLFGDNFSGQTSLSGYDYAFYSLFEGCVVQLANNLILPATTLAPYCYANMFLNCSILEYAPKLPAPTLVEGCYHQMFLYCGQMNYIECLATNPSWQYSYSWLTSVASSGVFIKDANTTWPSGSSGIPNGWTVEDYQP